MRKKVSVSFNKKFYSLGSIRKSIEEYRDVADFDIEKTGRGFSVSLYNFDNALAGHVGEEFSNHVLSIESTKKV
ncbi:MAG: HxsD-like protein [Candidatus Omnitrophota bacterium]